MDKEELKKKLKQYLARKIGTNIYICDIKQVQGTNKFEVSLGVSLPRMIYDDGNRKQYIHFVKFDNIYTLNFEFDNDKNINAVANPIAIFERVFAKEKRLRVTIENIILDQIYPNLIKVGLIQNNLRPIYIILTKVFNEKEFTQKDIDRYPKTDRLKKYVKFLEDYGIIRKNSQGNYGIGNIPVELKVALQNKKESEVLAYTFGYVLKDGRKYLKEQLNLKMLDTFIGIVTAYYYASSRIKDIIRMNKESLYTKFEEIYDRKIDETKFLSYLEDLFSANVLNKDDNLYFGEKNVLQKVIGYI